MAEVREVKDPFTWQTVQINNDLVRRLRGEYANGPTMPNGEPEFGWRKFGEPSAIKLEAADEIEKLRALLAWIDEKPDCRAAQFRALQDHNGRMGAAIKAECHRLEHDYNAADVTEARRALMAAAAS